MPKRHHYVPVTYLRNFVDESGHLLVFRKDEPGRPFRQRPESTGFERYYYSQFDDRGVRDDDQLEAIFSEIETSWPTIVAALNRRETMFEEVPHLITFLALMRVRVPAFRDAAELSLGHLVHTRLMLLHRSGKLPPLPGSHPNLIENLHVTIDPQKSLEILAQALNRIGKLLSTLHFEVLHNATDHAYLTSDNPVIYFNPKTMSSAMKPYNVPDRGHPIELLFPLSAKMVLRGRSRPQRYHIGHRTISDHQVISRINRLVCRFGYRMIFTTDTREASLIASTAGLSPVPRFDRLPAPQGGYYSFSQFVFGVRPDKPKWDGQREHADNPLASTGDAAQQEV